LPNIIPDTDEIYYFNFATGESTWDHPCDEFYRTLYEKEKKAKTTKEKSASDAKKQQAKKDVSEMLGKEVRNYERSDMLTASKMKRKVARTFVFNLERRLRKHAV